MPTELDTEILEAALAGLESKKTKLDEQIEALRHMLGGRRFSGGAGSAQAPAKAVRTLSPGARKRIAEAAKKRWAEYRAAKKRAE